MAGQRVETIKPIESKGRLKHEEGELDFGTELVVAGDKSLVALLGASPGASTAAFIAVEVLHPVKCFDKELATGGWLDRLKTIIPTYGIDLKQDAETPAHSAYDWHPDPEPQFVITLSGTLEFATPDGETRRGPYRDGPQMAADRRPTMAPRIRGAQAGR